MTEHESDESTQPDPTGAQGPQDEGTKGAAARPPPTSTAEEDGPGSAVPVAPTAAGQAALPSPLAASAFRVRRERPVLGPSLWIGGALLWAYVVMGEWVVTIELPEVLGWLVVLLAYAVSWVFAVRRLAPERRRALFVVTPGVLGLVWFVFVVFFISSLLGSSRRSVVAGITVMLWFISAAMFGAGRQLTAKRRTKLEGWPRAGVAMLWVVAGLGTLVSLLAALERA